MISIVPYYMLRSLIITLIIEIVLALSFKIKNKKDLLNILLVNLLTNPLLNSIIISINIFIGIKARNITLFFFEIFIVFIEGFIYQKVLKYKKINPYLLSLILNFSSYFLGTIINNFL